MMYELIEKNGKKVMNIDVNGQKIELNFGVRFNREADKTTEIVQDGIKFGVGTQLLVGKLIDGDIVGISTLVWCGTWNAGRRPSQEMIDEWMDGVEDLDQFSKELLEAVEATNVGKRTIQTLKTAMKQQEKMNKAKVR